MKIGVLALQGDFVEHVHILQALGVDAVEVRKPEQLRDLDGLIIPGGESTTFGKLALEYGLVDPIREMCNTGKPVWGTCAGMIVLAKEIGAEVPHLGLMDIKVQRNAFGRQIESFETDLDIPAIDSASNGNGQHRPYHAIFIRAPLIENEGPGVQVLARLEDGAVVAARQDNLMVTSFHPELTNDTRFHEYFLKQLGK